MYDRAHWSAGLLAIEIKGVAKGQRLSITRYTLWRATLKMGSYGWQWHICGREPISVTQLSPFQCSWCCTKSQGSLYSESVLVSVPDSEEGRHLCRCLTLLSLILVVSTSTCWLSRSKQKAYAIRLLPTQPWEWCIPQLANLLQSILSQFGLHPDRVVIPQPNDV